MSGRILVTPRSLSNGGHPAMQPLIDAGFELVFPAPGATPSEADLIAAIPNCVGWLCGVEKVSADVIDAADALRVISRNGTGVDNLPMTALAARGIAIARAEGANARGVAELALTLALSGLRDVVATHEGMKTGAWPRRIGREMAGAQVGVVGLGAIGASFASFCLALGAQVRGYDPFAPEDRITAANFVRVDLAASLENADVVSLHAPMPTDGTPLVGAALLDRLAFGAVLVNTARAGLVDEVALLAALDSGQISTYATDVFDTEPPQPSALLAHPRVILTSHIGGFTNESVARATSVAVANLLNGLGVHAH
ncbi:MAG: NAD(P)-dependent oxidoreductase [Cypionkella sp.]